MARPYSADAERFMLGEGDFMQAGDTRPAPVASLRATLREARANANAHLADIAGMLANAEHCRPHRDAIASLQWVARYYRDESDAWALESTETRDRAHRRYSLRMAITYAIDVQSVRNDCDDIRAGDPCKGCGTAR